MERERNEHCLATIRVIMRGNEGVLCQLGIPRISKRTRAYTGKITIGDPLGVPQVRFSVHPDMNEPYKYQLEQLLRESDERKMPEPYSSTDYYTGETVFSERAFEPNRVSLSRRVIFHFGEFVTNRVRTRDVHEYHTFEKEDVMELLEVLFNNRRPLLSTQIVEVGFAKMLNVDDHIVAELDNFSEANVVNGIFPVALSLITEYISKAGGTIDDFEALLQSDQDVRKLIDNNEPYPTFADVMLMIIKRAIIMQKDWRKILTAFTTKNIKKTVVMLDQLDEQNYGRVIYDGLRLSLDYDINRLYEDNSEGNNQYYVEDYVETSDNDYDIFLPNTNRIMSRN